MSIVSFAKRYAVAAAGATYALSLGLRHQRHRALIHHIAEHFGYDDHPRRMLPSTTLDAATSPTTPVVLAEPEAVDGNVTIYELLGLTRIVRERAPRTIFEIGTFDGRTTLNLAINSPPDAVVYTLDLPPATATRFELSTDDRKYVDKPASGRRLTGSPVAGKVRQLYGDSGSFDFSPYQADLVFVDGSHTYEYVMSDSRNAIELIPPGCGTIIWHDYGVWPGVTRALNELRKIDRRFVGARSIEGTSLVILDAS